MQGMVTTGGHICLKEPERQEMIGGAAIPDLSDPATVGCLVALVREHYPMAHSVSDSGGDWRVFRLRDSGTGTHGTEAMAWVEALELCK